MGQTEESWQTGRRKSYKKKSMGGVVAKLIAARLSYDEKA